MGYGVPVLLFLVVFNLFLYFAHPENSIPILGNFLTFNAATGTISGINFYNTMFSLVAAASAVVIAGLFGTTRLDAALIAFLLTFATFPIDVLTQTGEDALPFNVKLFVASILFTLYVFSIINFAGGKDL